MDPDDLEWLKEEKNKRLVKKGLIELAIEQEILMEQLQPDQIEEEDQGDQGNHEGIKVTRKEVIPNKVYRLFYEFLKRTFGITRRGSIIEFHVSGDEDYTIIIDDNLMHLTSENIEKVKDELKIPEENVIFKYGELNYSPINGITELILEGSNSQIIFQYLPNAKMKVFINIGGRVIVNNGRIIGGINIE